MFPSSTALCHRSLGMSRCSQAKRPRLLKFAEGKAPASLADDAGWQARGWGRQVVLSESDAERRAERRWQVFPGQVGYRLFAYG